MSAGCADALGRHQHTRTDDHAFVDRVAQCNINKLTAADEAASEIAHSGESRFYRCACVRRRDDRLLGDIEVKLFQATLIIIAGEIEREMRMRIHESGRKRRVAKINHLRVAWNGSIAPNI